MTDLDALVLSSRGRSLYWDKAGQPITPRQYMALRWKLDDGTVTDYARIGDDTIGDTRVSTVWLGVDHSFTETGPPIIYETMTFGGEHGEAVMRYCTEAQALDGHRRAVADLQAGQPPWFENEEW